MQEKVFGDYNSFDTVVCRKKLSDYFINNYFSHFLVLYKKLEPETNCKHTYIEIAIGI